MKVRLVVTVDVHPEKWEREYGSKPYNAELWSYFYEVIETAVNESGATHTIKELKIR